jgi:hypothetical protein
MPVIQNSLVTNVSVQPPASILMDGMFLGIVCNHRNDSDGVIAQQAIVCLLDSYL